MNIDGPSNEFLEQYRAVSSKLKRRVFRKPNVTEASNAFTALGLQCEMNELTPYSGMCWIAAARCEGSLGNNPSEINYLIRAARQFVKAEAKDKSLGCLSPGNENLQAALSCYSYASARYPENSPLSVGLNLEVADALRNKFSLNENSEQYLRLATTQSGNSLDTRLHCLGLLASCYIDSGDYTSALAIFSEMYGLLDCTALTGAQTDIILRCELSRVFLLLILRPTPQRLAPSLARLLEKYMWGNANDPSFRVSGMSEHLFILMQSLVMACQSLDTTAIPEAETDLWPHLTVELRGLLRNLVRQYNV